MSIDVHHGIVPPEHIGHRMRRALEHANVGVQQMAGYLGVQRNAVSRWLNGHVQPSKQTMRLWALRTGVSLHWLETGEPPTGGPDGGSAGDHDDLGTPPGTRTLNPLILRPRLSGTHSAPLAA